MNGAVKLSGFAFLEVLLLTLGCAGLSSMDPSFVAIGYVAIACMIAAPFFAARQLSSISNSAR